MVINAEADLGELFRRRSLNPVHPSMLHCTLPDTEQQISDWADDTESQNQSADSPFNLSRGPVFIVIARQNVSGRTTETNQARDLRRHQSVAGLV